MDPKLVQAMLQAARHLNDADLNRLMYAVPQISEYRDFWKQRYAQKLGRPLVKTENWSWGPSYFHSVAQRIPDYIFTIENIFVLNYLVQKRQISLSQSSADAAARNNNLPALKYLGELSPPIYPNISGMVHEGNITGLTYLASRNPPIVPSVSEINELAGKGLLGMLKIYESLPNPVRPDVDGANMAAQFGRINVLKYLASLTPPVYADIRGINYAFAGNHHEVVEYLQTLPLPNVLDPEYEDLTLQGGDIYF